MADSIYEVGVHLTAVDGLSGVLAVASKNLLGLHGSVTDLEGAFDKLKPAILGAVGIVAGKEILDVTAHIIEAGMKLEHFKAQLYAATGDLGKVADATNTAWAETTKNLNTNVADNVKNIQHLMNVTGNLAEAQKMLHSFTLADAALSSVKDEGLRGALSGGAGVENNAYNFARSLEQLGVTQDEEKLNSYTAALTRMMVAMRGLVDGSKLYGAINNAGGARYGWDEDFVTKGLGPLIQATNGRAGAQLYQLSRSFGQGVSTQMMAQGAEKYGLWKEEDEVWEGTKFKGMKVGSVFEADVLKANPVQWAGDVREMMRKRGVNVDDTNEMTNVVAETTRGNKNLGAIMDELVLPKAYQALMKERKNIETVPEDAVGLLQKNDPTLAMKAFHEQWDNLLMALGSSGVKLATEALNGISGVLNTLARAAADNPEATKLLIEGLTGLGGALVVLGTGAVLAAAAALVPMGAIGVAVVTIGGIIGAIAAWNWKEAAEAASKAWESVKGAFSSFGDKIANAISGMIMGVIAKLRALPLIGHYFDAVPLADGRNKDDRYIAPEAGAMMGRGLGMVPGDGVTPWWYQKTAYTNDNAMGGSVATIATGVFGGLKLYASNGLSNGLDGTIDTTGGAGGVIKASYGGAGVGGSGSNAGAGGMGLGRGGGVNASGAGAGSIGDGSAVDRALGMQGVREGQAAKALGHIMHAGEWCADFVNGVIAQSGGQGSGNPAAKSFMNWGHAVGLGAIQKGDVAVLNHGGHVGLFTGERGPGGTLGVVAGNTRDGHGGHEVRHYFVSPGSVYGARRGNNFVPPPPRAAQAPTHVHTHVHLDGEIVARNVSKHQAESNRFATAIGTDTRARYYSPGDAFNDAA